MQIVLQILLWILLAILALLLLLLICPIWVKLKFWNGEITVKLQVLFVSFTIWPEPETTEEELTEEQTQKIEKAVKDKAAKSSKKKTKKIDSSIVLDAIRDAIPMASKVMRIVFKGIFLRDVQIAIPVHEKDAALTAIAYGQTQAWIGGICGVLQNFCHLHFKRVRIFADYDNAHEGEEYFYCKIGAVPIIMGIAAVYLFTCLKSKKII